MAGNLSSYTATIASGASLSTAIPLGDGLPAAIQMPAAWTAANLTFQVSTDGVTWFDLSYNGAELVETVDATQLGTQISLAWERFSGARFLRLRSGTSAVPVDQAADRTLKVIIRRFTLPCR